ncbi:MAG: sulfite exporter TauE/SafE family protein [Acidimicrobiia bacterium]|nr:sulfite exporter TauE/SafE family protein [Acidimicrobiia bacterium]NNF08853.1 sulfite exporter TauE/SafE family protein [Acidimicrobiia bacterium]NNL70964.1 sulfite exporter TauE/SafE family protein [Acidimicrobiia bacterium]
MRWHGAILGIAAGFIGGLFGVGGGLLVVPGLVLWLHFEQRRASATSLATIVASSAAALARFGLDGAVDVDRALVLLIGAAAGAYLGARIAGRIPNHWLARGFVAITVLSALRLAIGGSDPAAGGLVSGMVGVAVLIAVGFGAGMLSATLGVGGGVVFVPALVTLAGLEQQAAQGTSLAVILPTVLIGTTVHARAGRIDWPVGALAGAGGILGGLVGAQVALGLPADVLSRLFAGFLVVMAVRMLPRTRAADPVVP